MGSRNNNGGVRRAGLEQLRLTVLDLPNKPMVPTAPTSPAANPRHPLRRHIGKPLDSAQGSGRRPTKEQQLGHGQRTTGSGQRSTSGDNEHRLTRAAT